VNTVTSRVILAIVLGILVFEYCLAAVFQAVLGSVGFVRNSVARLGLWVLDGK